MTTGASARDHVYRQLEELLGADGASYLMDRLPAGADDLATRSDVAVLRGETAELRGDLRTEMAGLRGELADIRAEMVTRAELAELLRLHVDASVGATSRWWLTASMGMQATTIAAVVAALRL